MSKKIGIANYEDTLNQTIRLAETLPPQHRARSGVDIICQLDLTRIYGQCAPIGGGGDFGSLLMLRTAPKDSVEDLVEPCKPSGRSKREIPGSCLSRRERYL